MRISDWSSDVCSSDLHVSGSLNCCSSRSDLDVEQHPGVVAEELLAAAAIGEGIGELFEVGEVGRGVVGVGEVGRPQEAVGPEARGQRKSGRASCRERGCQYVKIVGVADELKKKNRTDNT